MIKVLDESSHFMRYFFPMCIIQKLTMLMIFIGIMKFLMQVSFYCSYTVFGTNNKNQNYIHKTVATD
jgi:hypothetical protein